MRASSQNAARRGGVPHPSGTSAQPTTVKTVAAIASTQALNSGPASFSHASSRTLPRSSGNSARAASYALPPGGFGLVQPVRQPLDGGVELRRLAAGPSVLQVEPALGDGVRLAVEGVLRQHALQPGDRPALVRQGGKKFARRHPRLPEDREEPRLLRLLVHAWASVSHRGPRGTVSGTRLLRHNSS